MSLLNSIHHYVGLITCCVNHLQILKNCSEKKVMMKPGVNVRCAYSWIYMVTEPIDSPSVKFFQNSNRQVGAAKETNSRVKSLLPGHFRCIERIELIFLLSRCGIYLNN